MTACCLYLPLWVLMCRIGIYKEIPQRAAPSTSNTPNHKCKEGKTNNPRAHPEHQQNQASRHRTPKTEFLAGPDPDPWVQGDSKKLKSFNNSWALESMYLTTKYSISGKQRVQVWSWDRAQRSVHVPEKVSGEKGRLWSRPDYAGLMLIGWVGFGGERISQGD